MQGPTVVVLRGPCVPGITQTTLAVLKAMWATEGSNSLGLYLAVLGVAMGTHTGDACMPCVLYLLYDFLNPGFAFLSSCQVMPMLPGP